MGIFSRLFKIGQANVHGAIDSMEDPIKLTEQGIRDLKTNLQESMKALASVKALAIKLEKDAQDQKGMAGDYERKALLLLERGEAGTLAAEEADRLAREALTQKEQTFRRGTELTSESQKQKDMSDKLQVKVNDLKNKINTYENELVSLKARAKTASATQKINQQLANMDADGTVSMLERMREKVSEQEALSAAYGEMAESTKSIDEEIDKALEGGTSPSVEDSLAKLKARLAAPKEG